jgi:hypothetical protein
MTKAAQRLFNCSADQLRQGWRVKSTDTKRTYDQRFVVLKEMAQRGTLRGEPERSVKCQAQEVWNSRLGISFLKEWKIFSVTGITEGW